ncbi:MAG: thiamine phosphate synthase [Methylocella sp.]
MIVDSSNWIARLLPCGVRLVQLRVKDASEDVLRDEIGKAKALCELAGAQLIVNDYWRHAIDAGCDFIHLGQSDLDTVDLRAIRRAGISFGVSTHDEGELDRALEAEPAYVALGPIYPTILKKMPFPPQGLARIGQWRKRIGNIPLVGIGGITLDRAAGVLAAGADSAAVVTDITLAADPEQRARAWAQATRAFAH